MLLNAIPKKAALILLLFKAAVCYIKYKIHRNIFCKWPVLQICHSPSTGWSASIIYGIGEFYNSKHVPIFLIHLALSLAFYPPDIYHICCFVPNYFFLHTPPSPHTHTKKKSCCGEVSRLSAMFYRMLLSLSTWF